MVYPHDPFDLGDKVAVVTGALGLLGREHCAALASAGARIVATDLDALGCRVLTDELHDRYGVDAIGVRADVTNPDSVDGLLRQTLEKFDRVDVLVNNAAIDDKFDPGASREEARFESYSVERFRRILDVNVTGTFLVSQRLGGEMARRRGGSIVNVASTYGMVGPQQSLYLDENGERLFLKGAAYPTSKGAVISFTRFLAAYWGERGVRVNTLTPGGVQAGQSAHFQAEYATRTPLGRMASPRDYRGALLFLASDASAYMTGANLVVDGGWNRMVMARVPPAEELRRRAARLRLVLTDVDGVLTDGGVFYGSNGEVGKRFSVRDGMGVERLRGAGIETRFVTRERSAAVRARADKLGIPRIHEGVTDKRAALESILRDAEVGEHQVAYIGDDVNDLEVIVALSETGLTGAPFDAISEVALAAHFTSSSRGGHGAFRDFAEWILLLKSSEVLQ